VGDVQVAQGDLAGAMRSYRDSLAIADRLAKSDPSNADWQRDLSGSFKSIGDVQLKQGDLAGALRSYRDSLAIADRLAKSDPSNFDWQSDLLNVVGRIGSLAYRFVLAHDFARALETADHAITVAPNMTWLYSNRAHALMFLGRPDEARAIYLQYRGTKVQFEKSWEAVILEDFSQLRNEKLTHPLMDEIEQQFRQ
jgi:tetratricopeptide (TPR) repeat protein